MEKNFLQLFLETGLFDVGDNDTRLENLESAIADVQTKLTGDKKLLPSYTLVALDPRVGDEEQVLKDTEKILTDYWRALRTKYSDRPIQLLRGVILNALYNLGIADAKVARIIYLTATNFYPYAELNKEAAIIQKFLSDLSEKSEENAMEEWTLSDKQQTVDIPALKVSGLKFGKVTLDKATLEAGLNIAAGNDPSTGHGPQHGAAHWSPHFAKNATESIITLLTKSFNDFGATLSPETIETPINKFFTDFKKSLDGALKSTFNSITAVEQRSTLLWWKETLYSASLKSGYREFDVYLQPIIMAYDLYLLLPAVTPVSVDYLLKDTLRMVNSELNTEITFKDWLTGISKPAIVKLYKPFYTEKTDTGGRISVTDFITHLANDKTKVDDFTARTGIDLKKKCSPSYISVALLHDMMVNYLLQ
jgi:hypothetical protein